MPLGLDITPSGLYNFGPYISPMVVTDSNQKGWEPVFTELAQSYVPILNVSPLKELFPEETIWERVVEIRQTFEPVNTIFPVVYCGKPDVLVGPNSGISRAFYVQPLYIRESTHISHCEINSRVRPGTCNERYDPKEQIDKVIRDMVASHNLTWDVFRAMVLTGGIRYTDPRSGVPVNVTSRIPAHNMFHYNNVAGIYGRNEANIFRSILDISSPDPQTAGVPWTDPMADIVNTISRIKRWNRDTNKSNITAMYMGPELRDILYGNYLVKMAMGGGFIPQVGGDSPLVLNGPDRFYSAHLGMSGDQIQSIAGVPIRIVETEYKDPVDGVTKRVWPKNKVVLVAEQDANGNSEPIGRTQFCVSEDYLGKPGLWSRTQMETQIPAAPGMYIQMGNAGMPYIKYPHRVIHMTVCGVQDINNRLGLLGDLMFVP